MFDLFTNFILLKLETDERWTACNNMICDYDPCVNDDDDDDDLTKWQQIYDSTFKWGKTIREMIRLWNFNLFRLRHGSLLTQCEWTFDSNFLTLIEIPARKMNEQTEQNRKVVEMVMHNAQIKRRNKKKLVNGWNTCR